MTGLRISLTIMALIMAVVIVDLHRIHGNRVKDLKYMLHLMEVVLELDKKRNAEKVDADQKAHELAEAYGDLSKAFGSMQDTVYSALSHFEDQLLRGTDEDRAVMQALEEGGPEAIEAMETEAAK